MLPRGEKTISVSSNSRGRDNTRVMWESGKGETRPQTPMMRPRLSTSAPKRLPTESSG